VRPFFGFAARVRSLIEGQKWPGLAQVQIDVRQAEALFDVLDYNNSGTLDSEEFLEAKRRGRGHPFDDGYHSNTTLDPLGNPSDDGGILRFD
jgi:hypothetical protein